MGVGERGQGVTFDGDKEEYNSAGKFYTKK